MSSGNRFSVAPTVTVLGVMKARLVGAIKGHALLKKKADALTVRCEHCLKRSLTNLTCSDLPQKCFVWWELVLPFEMWCRCGEVVVLCGKVVL